MKEADDVDEKRLILKTAFGIGDHVTLVDEQGAKNWGVGIVNEINVVKTALRFDLCYYIKFKRHGGYRLMRREHELRKV